MPFTALGRRARIAVLFGALAAVGIGWLITHRLFSAARVKAGRPSSEPQQALGSPEPPSEELFLTVGLERTKFLYPGGSHTYRFHLAQETYVEIALEQHGIDVVGRLTTPNGEVWLNVDSPSGTSGQELLAFEARSAGNYSLIVTYPAALTRPGNYRLRTLAHRLATSKDKVRAQAERLLDRTEALRRLRTPASRAEAARVGAEARSQFRKLGLGVREAQALRALGRVFQEAQLAQAARYYLEESMAIFSELGEPREEVQTLYYLVQVANSSKQERETIELTKRGVELSKRINDAELEATWWTDLAYYLQQEGDLDRALEVLDASIRSFAESGKVIGEGIALLRQGDLFLRLAEYDRAIAVYSRALEINRSLGRRTEVQLCLTSLAETYLRLDDAGTSWSFLSEAIENPAPDSNPEVDAYLQSTLGTFYRQAHQFASAEAAFRRSLSLYQDLGDQRYQGAVEANLGALLIQQQDFDAAHPHLEAALALAHASRDGRTEGDALIGLAKIEASRGDLIKARSHSLRALNLLEEARRSTVSLSLRSSTFARRQQVVETHLEILMRLHEEHESGGYMEEAFNTCERAKARSLLDDLGASRARLVAAASPTLQARDRQAQADLALALAAMELSQEPLTVGARDPHQSPELHGLLARADRAESAIRKSSVLGQQSRSVVPLTLRQIQETVLDADSVLLQYCLGETRSFAWAVTASSISAVFLPPRSELEPRFRRLHEVMATARDALAAEEGRSLATELARILLHGVVDEVPRKRVVLALDGDLALVPFAALPLRPSNQVQSAAPESASAGGPALGLVHELMQVPSASAMFHLRERSTRRSEASRLLALIGDPVFDARDPRCVNASRPPKEAAAMRDLRSDGATKSGGRSVPPSLPRLTHSGAEVQRIAALAESGEVLRVEGLAASRRFALGPTLRDYKVIHFATHAIAAPDLSELSGLVLSRVDPKGKAIPGTLHAYEVRGLSLSPELVVLSACDTARGAHVRGEGIESLGRSFLAGGARQALVTLWRVEDEATQRFMASFYRSLLQEGRSASGALLAAQRDIAAHVEWRSPYFWAGFVLLGDGKFEEKRR